MLPEALEEGEDDTANPEGMHRFMCHGYAKLRLLMTDVLEASLGLLTKLVPPLSSQVVILLSRQCCDAVVAVKTIPGQVRMNKRTPHEPSHFVPGILRPVKSFFGIQANDGPGEGMRGEFLKAYSTEIFELVCKRYAEHAKVHDCAQLNILIRYAFYLASWKKMEESLRRHQRAQKNTFSLFGSAKPSKEDQSRDDERVRAQMTMDVDAFGKDAESLGVNIRQSKEYASLLVMVNTSHTEGE